MASGFPLLWLGLGLLVAVAAGVVGYLLGASRKAAALQAGLAEQSARLAVLEAERAGLLARTEGAEREADEAEERLLAEARLRAAAEARAAQVEEQLTDTFRSLASESLRANNQQFIELARSQFESLQAQARGELEKRELSIAQLVEPVRESLDKVQTRIGEVEKERVGAYQQLLTQVQSLATTQLELRKETGNLVGALRRPSVRGRWGELQLKRVCEMAGMLDRVDFVEQAHVAADDGDLRPDVVVRLPGGKSLVIDAKAPLEAYLESLELGDEAACRAKLQDHARQIRDHVAKLSRKQYWSQFENTPDFVVLFIPGEVFYSAALEQDPGLIEAGIREKVILATPTTLIALLRTVAYGWRQEALADDARRIADLGKELYDRILTMAGHWSDMGLGLRQALTHYNNAVGSLELRVLPTLRRFRELNVASDNRKAEEKVEDLQAIDTAPRQLQSDEMRAPAVAPPQLTIVAPTKDGR